MRNISNNRNESFEQWRQRLLNETAKFIEWGLAHPEDVDPIPVVRVGKDGFTDRVKNLFWSLALTKRDK